MAADQVKEPLYVVTAVNRLTGEREAISAPHKQLKAVELMRKRQAEMYCRRYQPWQKMRVEPAWIYALPPVRHPKSVNQ